MDPDEAANRLLQDDIRATRAKMAAEEVTQASRKLESENLRAELAQLKMELQRLNTKRTASADGSRQEAPASSIAAGPSWSELARCRTMSDTEQEAAASDLDQVLREVELNAADLESRRLQRSVLLGILFVAALVVSPGALIFLRESELLDIRQGTALCSGLSSWEGGVNRVIGAARSTTQFVLNNTACALLPPPPTLAPYRFTVRNPPLMKEGYHQADTTEWELMGEASLKVCARGTSEQTFLRRDDCDGCLCPAGSVWVHYKDPRFVGKGMDTCVPEKQWKDCISSWACGKHQPNYCWEFIWSGGRQDPEHGDYKVLVDSCSLHGGCFFMIQRWRRWELLSDSLPALHCDATIKTVGVDPVDIERTNATLNIHPEIRGWGFPSSVQTLLKLGPSSDPAEWRASHQTDIEQKYVTGRRNKAWQVVSRYRIHAYDYHGQTHEVAAWDQREHRTYVDS